MKRRILRAGTSDRTGAARTRRLVASGLAAAVLAAIGLAAATTYAALTLAEMTEAADVAIFAEVRDVQTFERDGFPWTRVTFAVERDLIADAAADTAQGDAPGDEGDASEPTELQLAFLGGSLPGGASLAVAGMPSFQRGERLLVLAYDQTGIASPIVGFRQGLWRVSGDSLVDEAGRVLGLQDGTLVLDGTPTPIAIVLDALAERFGGVP